MDKSVITLFYWEFVMAQLADVENLVDSVVKATFPHFSFRPNQRGAIVSVLSQFLIENKQIVLLDAPTGTGKSWIARIIAECLNKVTSGSSLFLTKTISLQNQYLRDFPEMAKLMGASNYSCHTDNPPAILPKFKHHVSCKFRVSEDSCQYNVARSIYKVSPLKTLNFAFFFTGFPRYAGTDALIIDECHNLPDYLIEYCKVEFNLDKIDGMSREVPIYDYLNKDKLRSDGLAFNDLPKVYEFIHDTAMSVKAAYNDLMSSIEDMEESPKLAEILSAKLIPLEKDHAYLSGLMGKLMACASNDKSNLVIDVDNDDKLKFTITPVFIPDYAMEVLAKSKFVLLMSATTQLMERELKRSRIIYGKVVMDYTYPIENRPFVQVKDMPKLNYETRKEAIKEFVQQIDLILDTATESGIIHSASYAYAEEVLKLSRHKNRLYIPRGEELRDIKSVVRPGRVLVSPSLIEGVDFSGDSAEFQIILKVPYPSLANTWIKTKLDADEGWYDAVTMTNIIQASGRPIRSAEDIAVTMMLDPSFKWLLNRTRDTIPAWFAQSIQ